MPAHLTPIEKPAPVVLLTGDPRRAFALAGDLMEQPRMSHQARGLWGYTGTTPGGLGLTVQSTGIGGAGAAMVLGDLAGLGVSRLIRLGSCLAPDGGPKPGTALFVERAICMDGASRQISSSAQAVFPDRRLAGMLDGIAAAATVSSHDLVARLDPAGPAPGKSAVVRDLQTATVLALSDKLDIEAASVLIVADGQGESMGEAELSAAFIKIGQEVVRRLEKD